MIPAARPGALIPVVESAGHADRGPIYMKQPKRTGVEMGDTMHVSGAHDAWSCRCGSARRFTASAAVVVSTVLVTVLAGVARAAGGTVLSAQETGWVTYTGAGGGTFR